LWRCLFSLQHVPLAYCILSCPGWSVLVLIHTSGVWALICAPRPDEFPWQRYINVFSECLYVPCHGRYKSSDFWSTKTFCEPPRTRPSFIIEHFPCCTMYDLCRLCKTYYDVLCKTFADCGIPTMMYCVRHLLIVEYLLWYIV
jgi:hypothetical protein